MTQTLVSSPTGIAGRRRTDHAFPWQLAATLLCSLCVVAWLAIFVLFPGAGNFFIALVITTVVVAPAALLLWTKAAAGEQWAVGAMAFAVVFVSDLSLRARAAGDTGLDAQSVIKFAIWGASFALIPLAWHQIKSALHTPAAALLFAFGWWTIATATYSITPLYTLAAGIGFLGIWTIAAIAAQRLSARTGLLWLMSGLLAALALSLVFYFLAPDRVMTPMENGKILRLSGLFGSPNNLGRAAALSLLLVLVLWNYDKSKGRAFFTLTIVPLGVACLVLSGSRASLGGLIAGAAILALQNTPKFFWASVCVAVFGLLLALFSPITVHDIVSVLSRSGKFSELATFTGRTDIWAWVLSAIEKEPLFGYGFATTRVLIPDGYFGAYGWTTTSAHNMWLQVWVTTGAIGLLLIVLSQLAMIRDLVRQAEPARDAVFAFVIVVSLMEAGPVGPSVNLLTYAWLWAAMTGHGPARSAA